MIPFSTMVSLNHMLRPQLPSSNFFEAFLDFVTAAVAAEGIFGKSILDFVTSALAAEGIFVRVVALTVANLRPACKLT